MGRRPSLIYESPMQPCATWVLRWLTFCTAHHSRCSTQKWTKNWAKPAIFGCASEPGQHISAVCSWVWGLGVTVLSEPNCIQVQQKAGSSVVRHKVFRHFVQQYASGAGMLRCSRAGMGARACSRLLRGRGHCSSDRSIACMPVCASSNRSRLLAGTRQEAAQSAARENFCLTWTPQPEFIASRQIFRPLNGRFQPR